MNQAALPLDGFTAGPLFAPVVKRRPARDRSSGGKEVWAKFKRAEVPWTDWGACRRVWLLSQATTRATGVQHSVDHIVPLQHPLVCGLHVECNLRILPLVENIRKSNNTWPDMWGQQQELL